MPLDPLDAEWKEKSELGLARGILRAYQEAVGIDGTPDPHWLLDQFHHRMENSSDSVIAAAADLIHDLIARALMVDRRPQQVIGTRGIRADVLIVYGERMLGLYSKDTGALLEILDVKQGHALLRDAVKTMTAVEEFNAKSESRDTARVSG